MREGCSTFFSSSVFGLGSAFFKVTSSFFSGSLAGSAFLEPAFPQVLAGLGGSGFAGSGFFTAAAGFGSVFLCWCRKENGVVEGKY